MPLNFLVAVTDNCTLGTHTGEVIVPSSLHTAAFSPVIKNYVVKQFPVFEAPYLHFLTNIWLYVQFASDTLDVKVCPHNVNFIASLAGSLTKCVIRISVCV